MHQCGPTSKGLEYISFVQTLDAVKITTKNDGWQGQMARENQGTLCYQHNFYEDGIYIYIV